MFSPIVASARVEQPARFSFTHVVIWFILGCILSSSFHTFFTLRIGHLPYFLSFLYPSNHFANGWPARTEVLPRFALFLVIRRGLHSAQQKTWGLVSMNK